MSINWVGITDLKVVNLFLLNSIPDQLEELYFNCKGFRVLSGSQYFDSILNVAQKVTNKLVIKNTKLQSAEIKQIHSVGFMWNMIDIEEPNTLQVQPKLWNYVDRLQKECAVQEKVQPEAIIDQSTPSKYIFKEKKDVDYSCKSKLEFSEEESKTGSLTFLVSHPLRHRF